MDKIKKFATDKGFDTAEKVGKWKSFNVYEAYFENDDDSNIIGLPQYILESGDNLRFCEPEETFDIMDSIT